MRDDRVKNLLTLGSEIAGAAVGGAVGFFAAGPAGAAGAGVLGVAAAKLLQDVSGRSLSRREEIRIGAAAAFAIDYIRHRLEAGERPRTDGFFTEQQAGISAAEEIFDGVLVTAKSDHEEQKARYYGRLFANVSFDPHCSRHEANYLLHVMDSTTFLQLVLLSIFRDTSRFHLRSARYKPGEVISFDLLTILSATFTLFQAGLLRLHEAGAQHGEIVLEMNQLRPAFISLTASATRLYQMAGLADIGYEHFTPVVAALSVSSNPKA